MLDLQLIRDQTEAVGAALARRGIEPPLGEILRLDRERRNLLTDVETLKAERNRVSKEIGRANDAEARQAKIEAMRQTGEQIDTLDERVRSVETELHALLAGIPNLPDADVPGINLRLDNLIAVVDALPLAQGINFDVSG